jgi:thymidylate kinase
MLFLLSGHHRVGKTTLWQNIKEQEKNWAYVPQFGADLLKNFGVSRKNWQSLTEDTNEYFFFEKRLNELTLEAWENNKENPITVCDRSLIDNYAYSYLYLRPQKLIYFAKILKQVKQIRNYKTYTFLIRPQINNFKIKDDIGDIIEQGLCRLGLPYETVFLRHLDCPKKRKNLIDKTANRILDKIWKISHE